MSAKLHSSLLSWYDAEKRDLPWRHTQDPYAIWVSEIMLQQTQVATVLPYFAKWMEKFPTLEALAIADEQEVLSVWQGLGYYRRCRMLQDGARYVAANGLPSCVSEWMKVPGVGRYTAGAICSIALGQRAALVDGNVERVYARLTNDHSSGKDLQSAAWQWAEKSLSRDRPGDWNQALMELGACVCKPTNPECERCPLSSSCLARKKGVQESLPIKTAKVQQVSREEILWIPYHQGAFGLRQIPNGEWWQGMWEFPRQSSDGAKTNLENIVGQGRLEYAGVLTYRVTHHKIRLATYLCHTTTKSGALTWVQEAELSTRPLPSPQRKALKLALDRLSAPSLVPEEACPKVTLKQ